MEPPHCPCSHNKHLHSIQSARQIKRMQGQFHEQDYPIDDYTSGQFAYSAQGHQWAEAFNPDYQKQITMMDSPPRVPSDSANPLYSMPNRPAFGAGTSNSRIDSSRVPAFDYLNRPIIPRGNNWANEWSPCTDYEQPNYRIIEHEHLDDQGHVYLTPNERRNSRTLGAINSVWTSPQSSFGSAANQTSHPTGYLCPRCSNWLAKREPCKGMPANWANPGKPIDLTQNVKFEKKDKL